MTDQNTTSRHVTETENVVSFPGNGGTSARLASLESMQSMPDGIPYDFALESDGVYQMRPSDGEDLLPEKICSPLIVKGICSRPNGGGWGRVVSVKDPDGSWHDLILDARDVSRKSSASLNALFDHGLELAPAEKAMQSVAELLASWRPETRYLLSDRLGRADTTFSAFTLGNGRVLGGAKVVADAVSDDVSAAMHANPTGEIRGAPGAGAATEEVAA